jgi:hypothetical protein
MTLTLNGYSITLEDTKSNVFHVLAVLAPDVPTALVIARQKLKDPNQKLVLYDLKQFKNPAVIQSNRISYTIEEES